MIDPKQESFAIELRGLRFFQRPGTSDIKAISEVVERRTYKKRGLKFYKGERWIDLGANVGAFSVWAAAQGCSVQAFEPDPDSFTLLEKNIAINRLAIKARRAAVVVGQGGERSFFTNDAKGNVWRNSLLKQWRGGRTIQVPTVAVESVFDGSHVKMDIEGSEFEILEQADLSKIGDLVFEWSFDIDPSIPRFAAAIKRLRSEFRLVSYGKFDESQERWPGSWFPASRLVVCLRDS